MKKLVAVFLLGLFIGIVIGFVIPKAQTPETDKNFSKNLEKAMQEINRRIAMSYPEVSARVKGYNYSDAFYLVEVEFVDKNGSRIGVEKYYISSDGKKLIFADYMISLEKPEISEDDDPWIGARDAKIVIIEFSDYACPYCAKFALEVEKKIVEKYGKEVRLVFRDFPIHGEISMEAAEAANCALEQKKFWEYHYTLFERQKEWYSNASKFYDYARELSLDLEKFKNCLDSRKYRSEVEKDFEDGKKYGVTGTPTFFINGDAIVGYRSYEEFARIIENKIK